MTMSVEAAAQALREATREVVRTYSTWYLIQGVLMVLARIVALIYPFVSTVALVVVLGWLLIPSGIVQGISLIGAQNVPNFWLQLVSVVLSIIVGVLFLRRPGEAVVTLALLLIVFFMVEGFAKLLFRSRYGRFRTGAGSSQVALLEYCCLSIFWLTSPR
jgi:uncharacterized membrane protein HdeD (DUF308 family)